MNNSQPGLNDLSGRAAFLMSGVTEADPGGKRVQVCVVQLRVSGFFPPESPLIRDSALRSRH